MMIVGFVQPGINIFRRPKLLHPFGAFFADCIPITLVSNSERESVNECVCQVVRQLVCMSVSKSEREIVCV